MNIRQDDSCYIDQFIMSIVCIIYKLPLNFSPEAVAFYHAI